MVRQAHHERMLRKFRWRSCSPITPNRWCWARLLMVVCYALFYITTVFSLELRRQPSSASRAPISSACCASPCSSWPPLRRFAAWAGDRYGRRPVLIVAGSAALLSGFLMEPMLGSGSPLLITAFLSLELFLMGATFAPMGALLPELFPTCGALHRRWRGLQPRRHPRRIACALHRAATGAARRAELGGRVYLGRCGDQCAGGVFDT